MSIVSSKTSDDGLTRETLYQLASGDESRPMTVRVSCYRKPAANGGQGESVYTAKIAGYATEVDDTSGAYLVDGPFSGQITMKVPVQGGVFDEALFLRLLGNMYTIGFDAVDGSNIPTTAVVDKLKFAVTSILD
jgi:hypothetical protein